MGPAIQFPPRIDRLHTNQYGPTLVEQRGPLRQDSADEVLVRRHQATKAEVSRGGRAIDLVARCVALLDPHDIQGFEAVRNDTKGLPGGDDGANSGVAVS